MRACNMDGMLCHILSTAQKDWVWVQEYRFVILSTQLLSGRFTENSKVVMKMKLSTDVCAIPTNEADSNQCRKVQSAKLVHF